MAAPEGRTIYVNGVWQYEFFYTDHLGNTRVAFKANDNQLVKTSETAFDPFGVVLRGAGQVNGYQNRFEYQDKEKESTFGLNRISVPSESPARDSEALVYVFWRMFFTPFSHKPSPSESPTCLRETLRELKNCKRFDALQLGYICKSKINIVLFSFARSRFPVFAFGYQNLGEYSLFHQRKIHLLKRQHLRFRVQRQCYPYHYHVYQSTLNR